MPTPSLPVSPDQSPARGVLDNEQETARLWQLIANQARMIQNMANEQLRTQQKYEKIIKKLNEESKQEKEFLELKVRFYVGCTDSAYNLYFAEKKKFEEFKKSCTCTETCQKFKVVVKTDVEEEKQDDENNVEKEDHSTTAAVTESKNETLDGHNNPRHLPIPFVHEKQSHWSSEATAAQKFVQKSAQKPFVAKTLCFRNPNILTPITTYRKSSHIQAAPEVIQPTFTDITGLKRKMDHSTFSGNNSGNRKKPRMTNF